MSNETGAALQPQDDRPKVDRAKSPVAAAIGAVFRGYRAGDQQVRERVTTTARRVGKVSIAVAAIALAGQAIGLLGKALAYEWQQASADRQALAAALDRQSEKIGAQTDRLGDLVEAMKVDREKRDADHVDLLRRLDAGRRR